MHEDQDLSTGIIQRQGREAQGDSRNGQKGSVILMTWKPNEESVSRRWKWSVVSHVTER